MGFQSGEQWKGNTNGRKPGSKNKITRDFYAAIEEAEKRNYPHPYLQMAEWANDESKPLEVRAAMLKECAAYRCVKPKQTIGIESEVPVFANENQAEQFLAEFISTIAPDLEPAELATMTRQFITSKREGQELQLKIQDHSGSATEQRIHVTGGLPKMPGHEDLIMPDLNGHNGHTLDLEKNAEISELSTPEPQPQAQSHDPSSAT